MQIYLGRLNAQQTAGTLAIMMVWVLILAEITQFVWRKGLKVYGAYGR